MRLLNRDDWYDIGRDLNWTLSYVDPAEAFPDCWSGNGNVPAEAWDAWDEPYRVTYRDYVSVQREKEGGAHAVREALKRANIFEKLDVAHTASSASMGCWTRSAMRSSTSPSRMTC